MSEAKDACGVFGIASRRQGHNAADSIYWGLLALQHRGQESAGIATFDGELRVVKGMGLVRDVFPNKESLLQLKGAMGIGSVRYSTTGASLLQNAMPFLIELPSMKIAIAFNGNISNYEALKHGLQKKGATFVTTTDTELIGNWLASEMAKKDDIFSALRSMMDAFDGAYSLAILTSRGELMAIRDPKGFRPLSLGMRGDDWIVASETWALEAVGAKYVREIEPGEVTVIGDGKIRSVPLLREQKTALCMFEFIYLSHVGSLLHDRPIVKVRERLGGILAELFPADADIVVGVPDSGRSYAEGYSRRSGIPHIEGLTKSPYIGRTFIMPEQEQREHAVKAKLRPITEKVSGKRLVLLEDSIVRGTTLKEIVVNLREAGAKEVHLRIGCPPIVAPCFMGIDFPTFEELAAAKKPVEQLRAELDVESLGYMTLDGLRKAIDMGDDALCMACLTGEYPLKNIPPTIREHPVTLRC